MDQKLGSSSQDILAEPVKGGYSLTTSQRRAVDLSSTIPGWGSDLDPAMRPGVPRDKAPELGVESLYPLIEPQTPKIKIHKSTEHARLTPVFGTSCPPKGLSGEIRDLAYKFSEGRLARWMALLVADRVDVVEGLLGDITRGRVPNVAKEMGLKSELKYNRVCFTTKAVIAGAVIGAVVAYARSRRR